MSKSKKKESSIDYNMLAHNTLHHHVDKKYIDINGAMFPVELDSDGLKIIHIPGIGVWKKVLDDKDNQITHCLKLGERQRIIINGEYKDAK